MKDVLITIVLLVACVAGTLTSLAGANAGVIGEPSARSLPASACRSVS